MSFEHAVMQQFIILIFYKNSMIYFLKDPLFTLQQEIE